jgi:excisionase family DNA binding protein
MSNDYQETEQGNPDVTALISLKEAAGLSGFSYGHMRYLARNGEIWATKLGRDWFTTKKAVEDYLAQDRRPGPKPQKGTEANQENT